MILGMGSKHMESVGQINTKSNTSMMVLFGVTIGVGIGSGLAGMLLALLLHYIQHIAYGYSPFAIISDESFLQGVAQSSSERRILILTLCGLIAGIGWTIIEYYGRTVISITKSIQTGKEMPPLTTACHALLQIITIALGSPLGREVAPRELGAIFATWLSKKAGLTAQEMKVMLACGAGAGLAAVYNVPFAGAVFVMEVLLCSFSWSILLPAFATSSIAAMVSWWALGNNALYTAMDLTTINASLVIWSIVAGPVIGLSAFWFIKIANNQHTKAVHGWQRIAACMLNFVIIGCLAIYHPSILGNGKSPAQLEFSDSLSVGVSGLLLVLRCGIVWSSLRAGAWGGLLTPSLANGALLGVFFGGLWNLVCPHSPLAAYSFIGATAFLASAQKMPLVAIIMIFELTRINFVFLVPIMLATCGAMATMLWCSE
jgi:H+/Cl- antiporter ClcA